MGIAITGGHSRWWGRSQVQITVTGAPWFRSWLSPMSSRGRHTSRTAFQHLLTQAQKLKEEDSLVLQPLLELLAQVLILDKAGRL
jgi:hypothetical protein